MSDADFKVPGASDPRLAAHANGPWPAWLWSADGTRILWANPLGVDALSARDLPALTAKIFGPADPHRRQIAQLAGRLNLDGAVRMERLRGFGAAAGILATCSCSRIDFPDGRHGVLVVAAVRVARTRKQAEAVAAAPLEAVAEAAPVVVEAAPVTQPPTVAAPAPFADYEAIGRSAR
jgi:hypothetical protein